MDRRWLLATGTILTLMMAGACSTSTKKSDAQSSSDPSGSTEAAVATDTPVPTATPCVTAATTTDTATSTDGLASTTLELDAAGFATIQAAVTADCATCHTAGSASGATTNYTTEAGFDADGVGIFGQLNAGLMPPAGSPALSATDKAAMIAYLTALASGATTATATPTPVVTTASPCVATAPAVVATATSTDSSFFDGFFNPPALTTCHSQGLIYNRSSAACDTAKLSTTCDYTWIQTQYQNIAAIQQFVAPLQTANWIADQCGTDPSGTPVAFFVCIQQTGSATCMTQDQAESATNLTLQIKCVGKKPGSNCTQPAP